MGKGGRPRKHDPISEEISFAIEKMQNDQAKNLIAQSEVDILDGEARTPLFYAALSNNIDMLGWLIDSGADINHQDRKGWCALHAAAQGRHIQIIDHLLGKGANPNLTDSFGNGPLWTATMSSRGDESIPSLLIGAGADSEHKNNAGRSPADMKQVISNNLKKMAEQGE